MEERRHNRRRGDEVQVRSQEELLELVATNAAQKVAAVHRRRLVVQAFLAAMVAASAISLAMTLYVDHVRRVDSRSNSAYNCRNLTTISGVISDFIRSDARLRYELQHYQQRQQVVAAFSKIITPRLLTTLQARADRLDARTQAYWTERLTPKLDRLAEANCAERIH